MQKTKKVIMVDKSVIGVIAYQLAQVSFALQKKTSVRQSVSGGVGDAIKEKQ